MALVKNNLISDLKAIFKKMKDDGEDASNSDFSEGIASACKSYIEAGDITTIDGGTVSSGVFAGSGSGSITLDDSLMSDEIDSAIADMQDMTSGGDAVLADAIFSGLNEMISKGEVETDVKGSTTSPSGSLVEPTSGTAKGKGLTCTDGITEDPNNPKDFVGKLKKVFQDMIDKRNDEGFNGDNYLAEQLADIINTYIATGTVTTSGQEALSGVTGTGKIA